jgi:hypothetical protein
MADDLDESIIRLDEARARRKSRLGEVDEAKLKELREASQAALADLITHFNAQYAIVNESGKAWVFQWRRDPALKREVLERIKPHDFRVMYENQRLSVFMDGAPKAKGGEQVTKSVADWWLEHPNRRQYLSGVTFDPAGNAPLEYWNLWRGFACKPQPGCGFRGKSPANPR